ncbi:MAG: hypothetical protein HY721_18835 [Planctomycetes bacterium]|nr:hypothetical protein [Planctomycetota bacterium]
MAWLRKRVRAWRRAWAASSHGPGLPAASGIARIAACCPDGPHASPLLRTVLVAGASYGGMWDTEIRGFLDRSVKFRRNVATQYHVRAGCEGSKPQDGRYEVLRILQRWDLGLLPRFARVAGARLVLRQEDTTGFPHRHPPRWPVSFYLHDVRKPWGPGRGGERRDNQSEPERGDAWWLEARAGELPWKEPGCGFASDHDPEADCGGEPLAWARLGSPEEDLVFAGSRLARHVEEALASRRTLDFLIRAGHEDELVPGSVRAFFSRELGDDLSPGKRPRLEVDWSAPALWHEERPFLLEPGGTTTIEPRPGAAWREGAVLAASLELDGDPPLRPETLVLEPPEAGRPPSVVLTTALNPVPAGEEISIALLETWAPDVARPEDLEVRFAFTAPSGRRTEARAEHAGEHRYVCRFRPDELGVWSYAWRTRPDRRFLEQRGGGWLTVVRGRGGAHAGALQAFADAALKDAWEARDLAARRRCHFRLVALQREIASLLAAGQAPDLKEVSERIAEVLPDVD